MFNLENSLRQSWISRICIERKRMMADPELSDDQKEVLRCICYWFSLEAMNSVPLSDEDEEDLF